MTNATAADLEISGLSKRFGDVVAVDDVTFSVGHGEIVAILGPSGSGKSTLLGMVGGQVEPDAGDIRIGGRSVVGLPPNRIETATVFQDYALFPHLSVGENVAFGLRMHRWPKDRMGLQVHRMLELVGLQGYENRRVSQLSGGQRQRVATARALAVEPRVLLLDEPLGALDKKIRQHLQHELSELLRRLSVTALLVTHDQQEAFAMADRVAVMHMGRLEQFGRPDELYSTPATEFVATFLGDGNLLDVEVVEAHGDAVLVSLMNGRFRAQGVAPVGARVRVLVRPEQLRFRPAGDGTEAVWNGLVISAVFKGGETVQLVAGKDGLEVTALALGRSPFVPGDVVDCVVDADGPVIVSRL